MITQTQTGTKFNNGIEYNEYPPPQQLVKAMKRQWAEELVQNGRIRIHHLEYFRQWENDLLGDPNDGHGLYHLEEHPMQVGSVNDIYAWCLSLPEIRKERLMAIAEKGKYDCTIFVRSPEELTTRIHACLQQSYKNFILQCGYVNYNRGAAVDKETLNSQKFHFNIFQKATHFQEDKEYRLAVTNCNFQKLKEKYIDVVLGNCSDIISIHLLTNHAFNTDLGDTAPLGRLMRT